MLCWIAPRMVAEGGGEGRRLFHPGEFEGGHRVPSFPPAGAVAGRLHRRGDDDRDGAGRGVASIC
ncbi:hypothetical protein [Phytohabitans houttuyneae]|uniref:hypothetical protein n=1 Tax=Phytohabitans houttuyneae TaxID=1076126 RepID=UPI001562FC79|nr:hypothetical protein [Phytohabitans houttuyneae]